MPISYTYNTIFIHVPKCAGTTIEKIIGTCTEPEYFSFSKTMFPNQIKTPQHFTYLELKEKLNIDWSKFYAFSVVRNPYARMVSEYKHRQFVFSKTKRPEDDPRNFSEFLTRLTLNQNERISVFDGHLEKQSDFLKNENGAIESSIEIFKFENLDPCWNKLKQKTGIQFINGYWSRRSEDLTPYQSFYNPITADFVYQFYKEDFENFEYSKIL